MMLNPRNLIYLRRFAVLSFAAFISFFALMFGIKSVQPNGDDDHGAYPTSGIAEGPRKLSDQAKANIGLKTEEVNIHAIESVVSITGSVKAQPKQIAHVTPRVGGIVKRLNFNLGERVRRGQTLLELESLELGADQIELIEASNQVQRLKNAHDSLKAVSAKKIRLDLADRQIDYLESLKERHRVEMALAQLKAVSAGKITMELERMRVELVKADVELKLLDASLKRIESLAEKRISAKKELIEKQAEYAKGKSELEGAKRGLLMLGVTEATIQKVVESKGNESVLTFLSDGEKSGNPYHKELLEKYVVLLEDPAELVASETEYQGAVIKVETTKQKLLAAGLTDAQIQELAETGTIRSVRDMSIDTLLDNYIALLEEPGALVESESTYREAVIGLDKTRSKLQMLGVTSSEISEVMETGEPSTRFTVTAPASGQIISQHVTLGATVEPADMLFEILDTATVWIEGDVYEDTLAKIQEGQNVRIRFAAYPKEVFTGKVSIISDDVDVEKRAAHLWIELENPNRKLKPGMFAELDVVIGRKDEVIAVPLAAVLGEGAEKFVFIEEGDVYNRREIALGTKDDRYVEVKDGLFPGDIVVVQGNHELMSASGPSKVPIADDGHAHQH